ncbi:MAG: MFS transporter [Gammaproteobacteria bacterium]|jgi:MFS family permease
MQEKTRYYKMTLFVLMTTIALDFMGFLLIFPLFPDLFLAKNSMLVSAGTTPWVRYFCYALALAGWPLGNFFGTAFLGLVSDQFGRKKILMLGLFVVSVSYFLQALSVNTHLFVLFVVARLIQGFFGGNYDVAQAAVADISLPDHKAKNMGLIALAGAVGIIFGPIVSALTTSSNLISWFSVTTPFWIASVIAFFNLLWIVFIFKETYQPKEKHSVPIFKVFTAFTFMFKDRRVIRITSVFFFLALAWGFYIQQIPIVMQKLFRFSPHQLGLFFIVLGVGFVFAMRYVQPKLTAKYALKPLYIYFMMFLAFFVLIAGFIPLLSVEWITVFIIAVCHVSAYGCIMAIASNTVGSDEQGKVMGGIGAIYCVAFIIAAMLDASFSIFEVMIPIVLAGLAYFLSGVFLIRYKKEQ